jgi:tetratricopeptide (TPR) repeat protein
VNFIKGKTLNVFQAYSPAAEELLSKAVKLDPSNHEAWIALGTCFWKKNDKLQAKACFLESVAQQENNAAYRELSMITRQLQGADKVAAGEAKPSPESYVEESISYAKKVSKILLLFLLPCYRCSTNYRNVGDCSRPRESYFLVLPWKRLVCALLCGFRGQRRLEESPGVVQEIGKFRRKN